MKQSFMKHYFKEVIKSDTILTIIFMPLILVVIFGFHGIHDAIHIHHYYFIKYIISFLKDCISTFGSFFIFDIVLDSFANIFKKHGKKK